MPSLKALMSARVHRTRPAGCRREHRSLPPHPIPVLRVIAGPTLRPFFASTYASGIARAHLIHIPASNP